MKKWLLRTLFLTIFTATGCLAGTVVRGQISKAEIITSTGKLWVKAAHAKTGKSHFITLPLDKVYVLLDTNTKTTVAEYWIPYKEINNTTHLIEIRELLIFVPTLDLKFAWQNKIAKTLNPLPEIVE